MHFVLEIVQFVAKLSQMKKYQLEYQMFEGKHVVMHGRKVVSLGAFVRWFDCKN